MSDRPAFRWATTGTRMLAGTLVTAGFVVAVVTAAAVPWPTLQREPVSVVARPAPADSVVTCAGSVLALGRDAADAEAVSVAEPQSITSGVRPEASEPTESALETEVPESIAAVFVAAPEGRVRTDIAATGSATVAADDLSGFAASPCRPPLAESWLVGGATTTGSSDIVVLGNPGAVAATVQLTVYGAAGPALPPGGELVVPAGAQRILPLAGLALGEESPVIRVSATGAPVTAVLQTSLTRTLLPGGLDQVTAIAAPETELVIPGVSVPFADPPEGSAATVLRLLAPSDDTTATVTVAPTGTAQPSGEPLVVDLEAGLPLNLELGGLGAREYTVEVEAAAPIVGAVWQTTGFAEGADFAWYTPAPEVSVPSLFATPSGPSPSLSVVNTSDAEAVVTVDALDGSSSTSVALPPGQSTRIYLRPRAVYSIQSEGATVRAGVSLAGDSALAGYPVWSADAAAAPIVVYP